MMKMVNGESVKCSPQETAEIQAEWDANIKIQLEREKLPRPKTVEEKIQELETKMAELEKR